MTKLAITFSLFLASPVVAQDCDWVDRFVTGVSLPDFEACDGAVCQWRFAYRNTQARGLFEHFSAALESCIGPQVALDGGVNHPDSYDLRQFNAAGGVVFVSIKDKAALQQTIVFLRAEHAP